MTPGQGLFLLVSGRRPLFRQKADYLARSTVFPNELVGTPRDVQICSMSDLFVRTVSQGLQALLPIAVYLAWARRRNSADLATALKWGSAAALLLTPASGYLFQHTIWQARWDGSQEASISSALG